MIDLHSFENQLLYSTVRIIGTKANGRTSAGTAFYYLFKDPSSARAGLILVTNEHVIQDVVIGQLELHLGKVGKDGEVCPLPESLTLTIKNFDKCWTRHPGGIDICAMPVGGFQKDLAEKGKTLFFRPLDEGLIPDDAELESMNAIEEVSMVGYPIGLCDEKNNFPVLRRGITASHPFFDFNGKPEGVVDIAAFPGSSGSPVLMLDQIGPFSSVMVRMGDPRTFLLGVLSSGPLLDAKGSIKIVEIPTSKTAETHTAVSVHLGYYIKAKELRVLTQYLLTKIAEEEGKASHSPASP